MLMTFENPYSSPVPPLSDDDDGASLAPPQSVAVVLTEEDFAAFSNDLNNRDATVRRFLRRQTLRLAVLAGIVFALSVWCGPQGLNLPSLEALTRIVAITLGVLAVVSAPLARWKSRRNIVRALRLGLYGEKDREIRATLDERGLELEDKHGEGIRYWSGIHRVSKTDSHLFVYLQPMQAAILPLRAFQSEAQFRGFTKLAEELWQKARFNEESAGH